MRTYQSIADRIAADIVQGRLRPGDRLPPQRAFAYQHGIAESTAGRAYAELTRRGLVTGEVGRGTFVRATPVGTGSGAGDPAVGAIDLELNFSVLPDQAAEVAAALAPLMRLDALDHALRPTAVAASRGARERTAHLLARGGWTPDPDAILFAGNGRQALAAAIAALASPGDRIAVEALTYPLVKGIASRLGVALVPLPLDAEGLRPDALARAQRDARLRAVYLQPVLHNPLGVTMSHARRAEIAAVLEGGPCYAIEDSIYAFLADEAPLAASAPSRTILIDSLSKRVAPGLTLGFVVGPRQLTRAIASAVRTGAWAAPAFGLAAGLALMASGAAARIAGAKRDDAGHRQALAREHLAGLTTRGDPRAYHLWLELPDRWRADQYVAAAARARIAVTPGSAFVTGRGHAPRAVRLALASPPLDELARALAALRRLAESDHDDSTRD